MTKAKNGTATAAGACRVMTARTPESLASLGSIVGRSKPNNPNNSMGRVTPTIGHQVTARMELLAGRERGESPANGYQEGASAERLITPGADDPRGSIPGGAHAALQRVWPHRRGNNSGE